MKTQLFRLLFKRNLSVASNLRPFLKKESKNKTFWYFRDSLHFKEFTFRNEKCPQNSNEETKLRKQLSDSIIKNSNDMMSEISSQELPLKIKLFVLDAFLVIRGSDDKNTIIFFDSLRPQIIFELQKQNIFVLIYLLHLSSIIKTENRDDFCFLITKIIERTEDWFLNKCPNDEQLCATDIAVLCHSLFRLKIKFKSNIVSEILLNSVTEEIKANRLNKTHVLSIVKYMRFIESNDSKLVDAIKSFIEINFNKFSFTECAHYLAYFANLSLYEQNIFHLLADQRSEPLLTTKSSEKNINSIRSKDLARFLWSVSSVNHKLNENTINSVVANIESLLKTDFISYPHFLIDCLKSLIILGIYPQKLLTESLNSRQFVKLISKSERNKVSKDLYFILESIAIERPNFKLERRTLIYSLAKELTHNIGQESKIRKKLSYYLDFINSNQKCCETELRPKLFYSLQHIGIASILFKGMSLEVIDSTVDVNGSKHLNGLISTKIRQMTAKNIPHFLIYNLDDLKHVLSSL